MVPIGSDPHISHRLQGKSLTQRERRRLPTEVAFPVVRPGRGASVCAGLSIVRWVGLRLLIVALSSTIKYCYEGDKEIGANSDRMRVA